MQVDGEVGRLDEILRIKHLQILMKPSAATLSKCGVCVSKTPLFQFGGTRSGSVEAFPQRLRIRRSSQFPASFAATGAHMKFMPVGRSFLPIM